MIINNDFDYRKAGGAAFLVDQRGLEADIQTSGEMLSKWADLVRVLQENGIAADERTLRGVYERKADFILDESEAKARRQLEAVDLLEPFKESYAQMARNFIPRRTMEAINEAVENIRDYVWRFPQGARPQSTDITVIDGHPAFSGNFLERLKNHYTVEVPKEVLEMAGDMIDMGDKLRAMADKGYDVSTRYGNYAEAGALAKFAKAGELPEDRQELTEKDAVVALMGSKSRTPQEKRAILHRTPPKTEE